MSTEQSSNQDNNSVGQQEQATLNTNPVSQSTPVSFPSGNAKDKKLIAGLLGIFLGGFGVHKFYLGYTKEAVIMLIAGIALTVVSCGMLLFIPCIFGLIEGILYLTKTDAEFEQTYLIGKKTWF
jgi:TM2 domain-containing membrane protein YozV